MTPNNFDLIRLFAASQVAVAHTISHFNLNQGFVAKYIHLIPGVPIFFFISGFLIYGSYEASMKSPKPLRNFILKRAIRIFPALWFCIFVTLALIWMGGYFTTTNVSFYPFLSWVLAQGSFLQFYNPDFMKGYDVGIAPQ